MADDLDPQCQEFITIDDSQGTLACWLPMDHHGPHYDEADNVTWSHGKDTIAAFSPPQATP